MLSLVVFNCSGPPGHSAHGGLSSAARIQASCDVAGVGDRQFSTLAGDRPGSRPELLTDASGVKQARAIRGITEIHQIGHDRAEKSSQPDESIKKKPQFHDSPASLPRDFAA